MSRRSWTLHRALSCLYLSYVSPSVLPSSFRGCAKVVPTRKPLHPQPRFLHRYRLTGTNQDKRRSRGRRWIRERGLPQTGQVRVESRSLFRIRQRNRKVIPAAASKIKAIPMKSEIVVPAIQLATSWVTCCKLMWNTRKAARIQAPSVARMFMRSTSKKMPVSTTKSQRISKRYSCQRERLRLLDGSSIADIPGNS
jgi:hypothetical protein